MRIYVAVSPMGTSKIKVIQKNARTFISVAIHFWDKLAGINSKARRTTQQNPRHFAVLLTLLNAHFCIRFVLFIFIHSIIQIFKSKQRIKQQRVQRRTTSSSCLHQFIRTLLHHRIIYMTYSYSGVFSQFSLNQNIT